MSEPGIPPAVKKLIKRLYDPGQEYQSHISRDKNQYHTLRYDFKPASVNGEEPAALELNSKGEVTIKAPNISGSSSSHTVFRGQRRQTSRPHVKEYVIVIDNTTGELVIQELSDNITVKATRTRCNGATTSNAALGSNSSSKTSSGRNNIANNNSNNIGSNSQSQSTINSINHTSGNSNHHSNANNTNNNNNNNTSNNNTNNNNTDGPQLSEESSSSSDDDSSDSGSSSSSSSSDNESSSPSNDEGFTF